MTPDQIIWALMLLVVLPSSLFNRAAAVTVGVFALGYLAWRFGLPEPQAQLGLYAAGLCAGASLSRGLGQHVAIAMFTPLAATMVFWLLGGLTDVEAWNVALWLTVMQIAAVPFGNDWSAIRASLRKAVRGAAGRMEMMLEPAR